MRIIFLINGTVLFVTCAAFFIYEYYTFRITTAEKLSTIGNIISANSTAALAFQDAQDAKEILSALRTESHIVAACLYDTSGKIFVQYVSGDSSSTFPVKPGLEGYRFGYSRLEGFQPVMLEGRQLGTLYLRSDMGAMYERLRLYAVIVALVLILSFLLAYALVKILITSISSPIMALANAAKIVSEQKDYSVRAVKISNDEMGALTDTFNQMLEQIQYRDGSLREFNQNLERKVLERTVQLETVNKELEGFSYSVSHDLRAPLRAIIGFTSILEEDYSSALDEEGRRVTSVIKKNTLKMGQLIDDLLAFSRMGRQESVKTRINMEAMVKEVTDNLASQYDTERIQWVIHALPVVQANANMIRQVWVNLISNAVKYSAKAQVPQVEIGSFAKDSQMVFFVKDNGVGFDQQYSGKLFKVFQRLHTTDEFEGTGVGLALVAKIIAREEGFVWAKAEVDRGATFYFSLPV